MPTPFLTLGGITVPVAADAVEYEYADRGKVSRSYSGVARSTVNPIPKLRYVLTTTPMVPADADTLREAAPHGGRVAASGRLLGGGTTAPVDPVTCIVTYGRTALRRLLAPRRVLVVLSITLDVV